MRKQLLIFSAVALLTVYAKAQTIMGVDVSSYQGAINWSSVKGAGYTFGIAKATEGVTIVDSYGSANLTNGSAAGVTMGAYHFAHPETNTAKAEADYFWNAIKSYYTDASIQCKIPPALDLEDPPSGPALTTYFTSAALTAWVQEWFDTIQKLSGVAPIIYTDGSIAGYLNSSVKTNGLWMADPDNDSITPPASLGGWSTWKIKQYSWTSNVPGITGQTDADEFNGSSSAFNMFSNCAAVSVEFSGSPKTVCPGSSVSFTDLSTSTGTITGWSWTFTGGTPGTSKVQNPTIKYNTPGTYAVKEVVTSTAGKDSVTYVGYIYVPSTGTLPVNEGFQEGFFPPTGWHLNLPSPSDSMWEHCISVGSNSSECMYFPGNCGNVVNITGERQQIYTPDYDFSSATSPKMWFDVAYEPSSLPTYSDTLDIYYSTDCGNTWTMVYSKGGATLCTTGSSTSAGFDTNGAGCFVPASKSAWRTDSVNIAAVKGKSNVMFSIESRSGWGNIYYVDNINITGTKPTSVDNIAENNDVKVYPNPNNGSFSIALSDNLTGKAQVEIYNTLGQQVYTALVSAGVNQVNLDTKAAGIYLYRIVTETGGKLISEGKLVVR